MISVLLVFSIGRYCVIQFARNSQYRGAQDSRYLFLELSFHGSRPFSFLFHFPFLVSILEKASILFTLLLMECGEGGGFF